MAFFCACDGINLAYPETENPQEEALPAAPPIIKTHPQGAVYQAGTAAVPLSVQAESPDGGVLTYQWYSGAEKNSSSASLAVSGATGASYTPPTEETGVVYYYVTVTNTLPAKEAAPPNAPAASEAPGENSASVASSAAMIEVNNFVNAALPAVSIATTQTAYCVGDVAELITANAAVTDGGQVVITWYMEDGSDAGPQQVEGAGDLECTPSTGTAGTFYYYFIAVNAIPDNGDGGVKSQSAASDVVAITVIEPIRNVSELQTFLNQAGSGASANDPCVLPPVIWTDTGGWNALFETINAAGKYVALDMSKTPVGEGCVLPAAFSYGCGSTDNARAGKGRVVSFVLPDGINSIGDFLNFNVIKNVTGVGVEAIGDSAFYGCVDLETINFPSVVTIDNHSFRDCASLKNANFPLAETIGHHAFRNCASLKNVDFPSAVMIGSETFRDCAILEAVNFPLAEIIDALAFYGCTSLETVNLPNVGIIKEKAFQVSGNATLAVALGQTAPSLERDIFYSVNVSKTITVNIPAVNSGYGTTGTYSGANSTACWANGFRGGGWGGSGFVDASKINQNITVILQEASSGAE